MKLVVFVAIFLPIAVKLGFRQEELIAILVMLGSATTVSSFVMAKNMGHEGVLSSSVVMLKMCIRDSWSSACNQSNHKRSHR